MGDHIGVRNVKYNVHHVLMMNDHGGTMHVGRTHYSGSFQGALNTVLARRDGSDPAYGTYLVVNGDSSEAKMFFVKPAPGFVIEVASPSNS